MITTQRLIMIILFSYIYTLDAQEILNVPTEIITKNKIHTCIEYTSNDSLVTSKDSATRHYVMFDVQGRKTEQNIYNGIGETQVFYLYDKIGRLSMFVWYDNNSVPKISRIYQYKYNERGDKIGYCDYHPNGKETCDSLTQYFYHTDTLRDQNHQRTIRTLMCSDKNMKDTLSTFYQYFNGSKLDSTVLVDLTNKPTEIETIRYFYDTSKTKQAEILVRRDDKRILRQKKSIYFATGLLNYVESRNSFYSHKKRTWLSDYSKTNFEYIYRK